MYCFPAYRVGEGRACWSLGNAYVSMGSPAQALTFAKKHLQISQEVSSLHPRSSAQCFSVPALPSGLPFLSFWAVAAILATRLCRD